VRLRRPHSARRFVRRICVARHCGRAAQAFHLSTMISSAALPVFWLFGAAACAFLFEVSGRVRAAQSAPAVLDARARPQIGLDCAHNAFFPSRGLNYVFGTLSLLPLMQPLDFWHKSGAEPVRSWGRAALAPWMQIAKNGCAALRRTATRRAAPLRHASLFGALRAARARPRSIAAGATSVPQTSSLARAGGGVRGRGGAVAAPADGHDGPRQVLGGPRRTLPRPDDYLCPPGSRARARSPHRRFEPLMSGPVQGHKVPLFVRKYQVGPLPVMSTACCILTRNPRWPPTGGHVP
jgi:hypothetical protein